jgi:hypothetical protein
MKYKFNEDNLIKEIGKYIDVTYTQHYAVSGRLQSMEFISSSGKGMDFCLANIMKYSDRYGKKDGYNRKDIIKIIHYGLLALNEHDIGVNSETK